MGELTKDEFILHCMNTLANLQTLPLEPKQVKEITYKILSDFYEQIHEQGQMAGYLIATELDDLM